MVGEVQGKFDQGWDRLREETFARQKQLGVIPPEAELNQTPRRASRLGRDATAMQPVLARQMEVYAGFLEHADYHVGRLIDALEDLEVLDDTLVYYVVGDNGASAEGYLTGTINEMAAFNACGDILDLVQPLATPEFLTAHIAEFGTPASYNHYASSWAHAMDTPYPVDQASCFTLGRHSQRRHHPLA